MKLFGYPLNRGDMVYSASMGLGKVDSVSAAGVYISHSGQRWRYNRELVRSGCKFSDLSWCPKPEGIQIKDSDQRNAAHAVLAELALALRKYYG